MENFPTKIPCRQPQPQRFRVGNHSPKGPICVIESPDRRVFFRIVQRSTTPSYAAPAVSGTAVIRIGDSVIIAAAMERARGGEVVLWVGFTPQSAGTSWSILTTQIVGDIEMLPPELLDKMNAYWRAAKYLSDSLPICAIIRPDRKESVMPENEGQVLVIQVTGKLEKTDYEAFAPELERLVAA